MIGQIVLFAGNQTPRGWKRCDGSALSSNLYRALYELIGTTYGGNSTSFNLPNLGGRYIICVEGRRAELRPGAWGSFPAPGADAPVQYVQSVTYAALIALITGSGLVPGKQYLITDFAARWFMLSAGAIVSGSEQTGVTEPLLVTALTTSSLHSQCLSTLYLGDVLEYDPFAANYTSNPGGGDYVSDPYYANGTNIISSFKGVINRRIDTVRRVDAPFDWRNLTFRRWALNPAAWSGATAYVVGNAVKDSNLMYVCIQSHTNKTPASEPTYWQPVLSADLSSDPYWSTSSSSFSFARNGVTYTCPVTSSYQDYKAFGGYLVTNVQIGRGSTGNVWKQTSDDQSGNFSVGIDSTMNTVGARFTYNQVGAGFVGNTIGTFFDNNQIGYGFAGNLILNTFEHNRIAAGFYRNWIAGDFQMNTIEKDFASNLIKSTFYCNDVGYGFSINNYTASTLVYNSYRKTLSRSPDGTRYLMYINNAGAATIVSHTT